MGWTGSQGVSRSPRSQRGFVPIAIQGVSYGVAVRCLCDRADQQTAPRATCHQHDGRRPNQDGDRYNHDEFEEDLHQLSLPD